MSPHLKHLLLALCLLCCLLPESGQAQSDRSVIDSLRVQAIAFEEILDANQFWLHQAEVYHLSNPGVARFCLEQYDPVGKRNSTSEALLEAQNNYWQAWFIMRTNPGSQQRGLAKAKIEIAQQEFAALGVPSWQARGHILLAKIYIFDFDTTNATVLEQADSQVLLAARLVSQQVNELQDSLVLVGYLHFTRASIANLRGDHNSAKASAKLGLATMLQQTEIANKILAYRNIIHFQFPAEVQRTFDEALSMLEERTPDYLLGDLWKSRGDYFWELYSKRDSLSYFTASTKSYSTALRIAAMPKARLWLMLGYNYHTRAARLPHEGENTFLDTAQTAYLKATQYAVEENNKAVLSEAATELGRTCRVVGDCALIVNNLSSQYQAIIDSNQIVTAQATQVQEKYKQYLLQRYEQQRRTTIIVVAAALLFLLIAVAGYLLEKRRRKLLESERAILRAQLSPHFISNNLNIIESHINFKRNELASKHVVRFSKLCRKVLNHTRQSVISLAEELERERTFLELETYISGDDFSYRIDVSKELDLNAWSVSPMILNPFVENAVLHGFRKKSGKGSVTISIAPSGSKAIRIIIEDDGLGRAAIRALQAKNLSLDRISYGADIAQEQIEKTPGASLVVEDRQDTEGAVAGTRVIIQIPKKKTHE